VRDTWYGNARDIVKWGAIVEIGNRFGVERVVQVAFLRPGDRPVLVGDLWREPVQIPDVVWQHIRNIDPVETGLSSALGLEVEVIDWLFDPSRRKAYASDVEQHLRLLGGKKLVLLDPDTGMEPQRSRPTGNHILCEEIVQLWNALRPNDWIILYQHRWRESGWDAIAQRRFGEIVQAPTKIIGAQRSHIVGAPKVDAIFLAARKL
jgi:hypothetical protein